ncbi:MAG: N-terminal phage integrase SAM-like domain-containing protein [Acidobacteriota bacterium]|nr:N-terminal phage integrase SAM-like domain-containing protein [Acidobacteriota bacterium]
MRGQIIEKKKIDRKNSVWLVRVQTRDGNGKLKSRSATVRGTITDAEKKRTTLLSEKDTKGIIASPSQNLNQFLDLWLSVVKPKLHSRTWQDYNDLLQRYVREPLGKIKLENLKATHLQNLYKEMQERGLSPRVVRYTNSILRSALLRAQNGFGHS